MVRPNTFHSLLVALVVSTILRIPPARSANLFVSSHDTGSVVRFDGRTGEFRSVFVPPESGGLLGAHGLAFGPDGNLYVNNRFSDNILRYDGRTGAFLGIFVPAGLGNLDTNIGLVFGPDGNLYVSCFFLHQILRFDGTTGALINVFVPAGSSVLSGPHGMAFGSDGNLYVSSFNTHQVLCYNGQTGALARVFVGERSGGLAAPTGLTFGPDGNLYVSSNDTDSVLRYDGKTGEFLGAFVPAGGGGLDGPSGLQFGPDGSLYVASEFTQAILRYDGQTGAFLGRFADQELRRPTWLTFSPPESPDHLTVIAVSSTQLRLSWSDNSDDEDAFEIERKTGAGPFTSLGVVGANVISVVDNSVRQGEVYSYRVRAISALGRSVFSNEIEIGVPVDGRLRVKPLLLMPATPVGDANTRSLLIENVGTGALTCNVGNLTAPFAVVSGGGRFVLGPGQSQAVAIRFTPRTEGAFAGSLRIECNDLARPTVHVLVVGEGTGPPG
jgi:DNA-binding beta-propeller fold protein YncE